MDKVLVGMIVLTAGGYLFLAISKPSGAADALDITTDMFMQSVPWIIVSMFAAGLMAQLINPVSVAKWLGKESGIVGILIATALGLFGTGSRWAMYPLAASLLAAEASPGSVFAFVTTWQLVSVTRLPAEIPFYGFSFATLRAVVSILVAIIGGLLIDKLVR